MSKTPDLQFRRLEEGEVELARELAQSMLARPDPDGEAFGLGESWSSLAADEGWGLIVRGNLVGAAWLRRLGGGVAQVVTVALPPGWWKMGLTGWMLEELAQSARKAGDRQTVVRLAEGGPKLGEILADAGFEGPDPEADDFPHGEWKR